MTIFGSGITIGGGITATGGPAPGPSTLDANFNYVALLLNGDDAANGSQNNTFLDSSNIGFSITNINNVLQGTINPFEGSYYNNFFTSGTSNSYVRTPATAALNFSNSDLTIEMWVKTTDTSRYATLISKDTNSFNSSTWILLQNNNANGDLSFWSPDYSNSGPLMNTTGIDIADNAWHHIAVVRNGSAWNIYVDGVSYASATWSGTIANASTPVNIAGDQSFGRWWQGYITNLRVVIGTAVYTANFTPPTSPLTNIVNTALLTCQSNRFIDNSSNALVLTSGPLVQVLSFSSPFLPSAAYSPSDNGGSGLYTGGAALQAPSSSSFGYGTNNFTIEFWVYLNALTTQTFFSNLTSNPQVTPHIYYDINDGLHYYVNGSNTINGGALLKNTWCHIALSRSSGSTKLFVDGTQVGSTFSDSNNYISPTVATVGGWGSPITGTNPLDGYISGLRVVKGTGLYTANFTPPTTPPTDIANTVLLLNNTNSGIPDWSMNNNIQTVGAAAVNTTTFKYGTGSVKFNGTTSKLNIPYNPAFQLTTGNFTIEFWAYFNTVASGQQLAGQYITAGNQNWAFYTTTSGQLDYYLSSSGSGWNLANGVSVGSISTGLWYHVALVRNGSTFTPYLNGVAGTTTTNAAALYPSTTPLTIGSDYAVATSFDGYIDDFRITNGVARYTSNFAPPSEALPTS